MTLALDANVIVDLIRGHAEVRNAHTMARLDGTSMSISVLVLQELRFGAELCMRRDFEHQLVDAWISHIDVIAYEPEDALKAAQAQAAMERVGRRALYGDFLIGAHALSRGHVLVTANTRHFENIPGLRLVDWTQPLAPEQDAPDA